MKFTCSQQSLSKALNTVSKAVTSRTTIPILKGILLKADEKGTLTLSASDLDISIEKTLSEVSVEIEGEIVVLSKLFTDIIRKLPNEDILIELKEDQNVLIKTGSLEFNILGISSEEFPALGDIEEGEKIVFEKELLKGMIRKTVFSASIDDSKGIITGVLMELEEKNINMIALDGFRMAVVREEMKNEKKSRIIISGKILGEINKIVSDFEGEGDIEFILSKKKAVLTFENTKIVIRLLDGEFIKYKDILPSEKKCEVKINKTVLHESMERAAILSREGKNNLIKFAISGEILTITSRSDEGNVREEINITKEGSDIEIGFNSKYVIEALKAIDDEEIVLQMVSSVKPCVIKPVSGNGYEYLILPVRIA